MNQTRTQALGWRAIEKYGIQVCIAPSSGIAQTQRSISIDSQQRLRCVCACVCVCRPIPFIMWTFVVGALERSQIRALQTISKIGTVSYPRLGVFLFCFLIACIGLFQLSLRLVDVPSTNEWHDIAFIDNMNTPPPPDRPSAHRSCWSHAPSTPNMISAVNVGLAAKAWKT